jgi:hypothetical protein
MEEERISRIRRKKVERGEMKTRRRKEVAVIVVY